MANLQILFYFNIKKMVVFSDRGNNSLRIDVKLFGFCFKYKIIVNVF